MRDYEYEHDSTYCYPESKVLKNKLNIKDASKLIEAERNITAIRILELKLELPNGELNAGYYKALHYHIFQDIYEWAGKTRTVNISKGSSFCSFQYIDLQLDELFQKLNMNIPAMMQQDSIYLELAYYLSELNAIHPFREGNGRTQRAFIEILAARLGWEVDFSSVSAEEMITASINSFYGDYDSINQMMRRITHRA